MKEMAGLLSLRVGRLREKLGQKGRGTFLSLAP